MTNPAAGGRAASTPSPRPTPGASIPIPVRTLGRAVSLLDYADFALAFAGIGKAQATVLPASAAGRSSS